MTDDVPDTIEDIERRHADEGARTVIAMIWLEVVDALDLAVGPPAPPIARSLKALRRELCVRNAGLQVLEILTDWYERCLPTDEDTP